MSFRNWCFTANLEEEYAWDIKNCTHKSIMKDIWNDKCRYMIFQLESGEKTHREHLQGYVELKDKLTLKQVKKAFLDTYIDGAHWEPRKGSQKEAIDYCQKEDTRIEGPFEKGTKSSETQGKRLDISNMYDSIRSGANNYDLIEQDVSTYCKYYKAFDRIREDLSRYKVMKRNISDRKETLKTYVLYGDAGTGKTRYIFDNHSVEDVYTLPFSKTVWFDGYMNEPVLLIDEMGPDRISIDKLLAILDIYPMQFERKGGMIWNCWNTVYITSNYSINEWFPFVSDEKMKALLRRITQVKKYEKIERVIDFEPFIDEDDSSNFSG